jgi:hypothetical protein
VVERKYADYLRGAERWLNPAPAPDDSGGGLARAWLHRSDEDEVDPIGNLPVADVGELWTMTLEQHGGATNHSGSYEDLVALAVAEGIDEFHVWSSARREFAVFNARSVRPLD